MMRYIIPKTLDISSQKYKMYHAKNIRYLVRYSMSNIWDISSDNPCREHNIFHVNDIYRKSNMPKKEDLGLKLIVHCLTHKCLTQLLIGYETRAKERDRTWESYVLHNIYLVKS